MSGPAVDKTLRVMEEIISTETTYVSELTTLIEVRSSQVRGVAREEVAVLTLPLLWRRCISSPCGTRALSTEKPCSRSSRTGSCSMASTPGFCRTLWSIRMDRMA
eukprot:scaffold7375_cov268-Pinguiococcus_pyrenoidosus.AAC.33